ncbi:D-tagatose-bisphosphate aldolase, class II, non-catalytic subunit [Microbulbifer salipaludis]|uniref:D-tagatose-bisphosphate aldolase, class II, non-catalytic subunit n=1 Tax=Microbulbifer salipaludis TaxID=187980 RepID=A0ABS3E5T6_9GAMM|nr:D-tagatose-bisphosphate aldolase, class II, non-catalytic subunit [Microbulbifer salipaludis]MBN8430672.1 D-tagatose-bisphosphate aldolase, class II, non-catalytic subunit [Microbulbifer salipaludis]
MLQELIRANLGGEARGIYAICSAHGLVLEAAMEQALADDTPLLIEATANQVNQFGGYTGMQPADFFDYVATLAERTGLDASRIILGGDHLGPVCWQNEPAAEAMAKARDLIDAYVTAGFSKIHLDCSMPCADDALPLADAVIAERAADLCRAAEDAAARCGKSGQVVYVIGTEVPPPGGAKEAITELEVTRPEHARNTIELHQRAFAERGLDAAWSRVVGLVVQPGVEFDHTAIIDYQPHKATELKALAQETGGIAFEAHSTDYQTDAAYQQLVRDHFAILKVGPQLTFALREALFALSYIEDELPGIGEKSNLRAVCEARMQAQPGYWQSFYEVAPDQQPLYRRYSYSDRIRYYWPDNAVNAAVNTLLDNLSGAPIPLPLLSQFFPQEYHLVREGQLENAPRALIKARIRQVTAAYANACWKQ